MATSGVNTNIDTARQVISDALAELGVGGGFPDASDLETGRRRLNWMLKDWQQSGLSLWRDDDITIPWPAYTVEGTLDQSYTDLTNVRVMVGTNELLLGRLESSDYAQRPNKLQTGSRPITYTLFPALEGMVVKLWPVPDVDVTLYASGNRVIEDVTDLSQNIDVPQQYTRTVMLNLAVALIPVFGKASDPNAALTVAEARLAYTRMLAADRPASYFMGSERGYERQWL